jgi:hypothetical protein
MQLYEVEIRAKVLGGEMQPIFLKVEAPEPNCLGAVATMKAKEYYGTHQLSVSVLRYRKIGWVC